jgi:outer membrane protein
MKNLSLILNGVLLVAVIVLFILFFGLKKQIAPATGSDENQTLPMTDQSIVYVDIDSIMTKYNMSTDVTTKLQAKLKVSEDQLAAKDKALRKEAEDFQYKIDRGLLTRTEAEQVQQGLQMKEQEFYQLQNQLQMQLAEEQQVAQRKVLNAITEYLKGLEESNEYNYHYILGHTFGGGILYANQGLNITKAVIKGLNEEYDKTKTEKED